MKNGLLKSVLRFWQEIIFLVAVGILVFGIAMNASVAFQQVFNIIFFCIFVLLLVCLFGQFYWKSIVLSVWLAVQLGFGSAYMILAALSDLAKMTPSENGYIYTVFALFLSMGLTVVAISMPFKYIKSYNQEAKADKNKTHPFTTE